MEHIDTLSTRITEIFPPVQIPGSTHPAQTVRSNISGFTVDFARLVKNIKETSFSESDRMERCKRLGEDSGIDPFYIRELTS